MTLIGIIAVIIIIVGIAGYYYTVLTTKLKEILVMGTPYWVESSLDPAQGYDFLAGRSSNL